MSAQSEEMLFVEIGSVEKPMKTRQTRLLRKTRLRMRRHNFSPPEKDYEMQRRGKLKNSQQQNCRVQISGLTLYSLRCIISRTWILLLLLLSKVTVFIVNQPGVLLGVSEWLM